MLQNKVNTISKLICSWIKNPTKQKNKNECFMIITVPGNIHHLYARTKLSGEGRGYFSTSHRSSCPITDLKAFALSKFDRKAFSSYSCSALYVSVPGCHLKYYFKRFFILYKELNSYPSGHLVPSPILGLANAPTVETKFLELAMSLLDFSPRIPLGTFSILLFSFNLKDQWLELLTNSNTFKANCSTQIVYIRQSESHKTHQTFLVKFASVW